MKPLILFDFDGVIANSLNDFEQVLKDSFARLGHFFLKTRDDFLDLFNDNLYASFEKHGISSQDIKNNFDYVGKVVNFEAIKIYDGIEKMLKEIRPIATIAIVSSNKEEQIKRTLKGNSLEKYFLRIFGYESGISKVDKLKMAIKMYGSHNDKTYYAVDTVGDLIEARHAGVRSIAVGWGWHTKEKLMRESPNYYVESCNALSDLVKQLCQI